LSSDHTVKCFTPLLMPRLMLKARRHDMPHFGIRSVAKLPELLKRPERPRRGFGRTARVMNQRRPGANSGMFSGLEGASHRIKNPKSHLRFLLGAALMPRHTVNVLDHRLA
jgi:hypothetical protein